MDLRPQGSGTPLRSLSCQSEGIALPPGGPFTASGVNFVLWSVPGLLGSGSGRVGSATPHNRAPDPPRCFWSAGLRRPQQR